MKKRGILGIFFGRKHEKTAMDVVAHAKWQKSRGRRPSESYKGERNPQKALNIALKELATYEPMIGEHIASAAKAMASIGLNGHSVLVKMMF